MNHSCHSHTDTGFEVDLKQALIWVARALDYVGVDDTHHSHRVAYIAYQCARVMGWEPEKAEFCYFAGMIHDCGVSETQEHKMLLGELVPQHVKTHCLRGYRSLKQCRLLRQFATPVLYHHTHWSELKELDLPPFEKEVAALLYLSDRLDFMRSKYVMNCHCDIVTLHEELIAECIMANVGTLFNPSMAEAMVKLVMTDAFWFAMESENIETIGLNFKSIDWLQKQLTIQDMNSLGMFIAQIVDAKSPFTYQHSQKVAELSRYLAIKLGLNEHDQEMLYIAGLVHDIGKLKTPDEILHKEGSLNKQEYTRIKRHTIDTQLALHKIDWDDVNDPNSMVGIAEFFQKDRNGIDQIFWKGGSKDDSDITDWAFRTASPQPKDDFTNAYAAAFESDAVHFLMQYDVLFENI